MLYKAAFLGGFFCGATDNIVNLDIMLRIVWVVVLLLNAYVSKGGVVDTFQFSAHLGLPEQGINKVLCMKDGYTLVFHFGNRKAVRTIVFDTSRRRVANVKHELDELDVFMISTSIFKGIYEVNGEAVLFVEQQNTGKHVLLRLRFDGHTGKLIEETVIAQSESLLKPTFFYVMKDKQRTGYEVLLCKELQQFRMCTASVQYYNAAHNMYKDVPLKFDRNKYDFLHIVSAETGVAGVSVAFGLSNMEVNGTGMFVESTPVYKHFLQLFYLPHDSDTVHNTLTELPSEASPLYGLHTYNEFAGRVNYLLLNFREAILRFGIDIRPASYVVSMLFMHDAQDYGYNYQLFTNKLVNKELGSTDTAMKFIGLPIKMLTNSNGLSTVVSTAYNRDINTETYARWRVFETYLEGFCVTQYDDYGNELWAKLLPAAQYYMSYSNYYTPKLLARRWQSHAFFNDLPAFVTERQFVGANVLTKNDNIYIVYNDCAANITKVDNGRVDTMYSSEVANAVYYKIDKKRNVSKHFLMGAPLQREYKSVNTEGADFDEERGMYATIVRYKRGRFVTLRVVWAPLD